MSLPPELRRRLLLVSLFFALLLAGVSAAGAWYYRNELGTHRAQAATQLVTIAEFKAAQLSLWWTERHDDAIGIAQDQLFVGAVSRFMAARDAADADADIRASLSTALRQGKYSALIILDAAGRTLLPLGAPTDMVAGHAEYAARAAETRTPVFASVTGVRGSGSWFDIYAPIALPSGEGPVHAVLLMRLDAGASLLTQIRFWPADNLTAETLLVERSDTDVRFVVEPRRQVPAGGIPIASAVPAAMAARGVAGVFDDVDVRGIETLAAIRPVPGTAWAVVTKIDRAEVDAPVLAHLRVLAASVVALFVAAGVVALLLVRREEGVEARLHEASREQRTLQERFEALSSMVNDILLLVDLDGRVLDANDRFVEAYGYAREELPDLSIRALRPASEQEAGAAKFSEMMRGGGGRYETVHVRKDGSWFPVEISVRVLSLDGRGVMQAIIRDITERHHAAQPILRLNSLLTMRSQVNQAIARAVDEESLLRQVCSIAVDSGQFTLAVYNELRPGESVLRIRFWAGRPLASSYEGQQFTVDGTFGAPSPTRPASAGWA